ncbi:MULTISPECIES: hypothetical protein [unclassified Pyramidobacter]|uniref:hypothetical protein n=1 Tax=unclassified Pyramidobacter TaxID=2632171 RepID=UPI0011C37A3D|nr:MULTISPECIES: hypothetical protein [unclassified Pyramidobacter]MCI7402642.1 hypothetical protein [Pyramidobacter sp.]
MQSVNATAKNFFIAAFSFRYVLTATSLKRFGYIGRSGGKNLLAAKRSGASALFGGFARRTWVFDTKHGEDEKYPRRALDHC